MRHNLQMGLMAGVAAAGAAGGALALYGLGVPFAVGVLGVSAVAGIAVRAAVPPPVPDPALLARTELLARIEKLEATLSALRHDVRGALSPALIMTDRLLAHSDPAIVRAGQAVAKSVDRATALLRAAQDPSSPAASSPS